MAHGEDYLQDYDGDLIESDFDDYDLFGERTDEDDNRSHNFDDIELHY